MQTKQEINQIVDTLPEDFLQDLLQYLRQLEKASKEKIKLSLNLNTILTQDRELLKKLAQ